MIKDSGIMRIEQMIYVPIRSGFFTDDQAAIRADSAQDGFNYIVRPVTPGFTQVRMPGEAVSVLIVLEDGQVGHGDCAVVQYSGVGGRDPLLRAEATIELLEKYISTRLVGREIADFRDIATEVDRTMAAGERLHTSIRYGVSQAILDCVAKIRRSTMAEVVRDEYDTRSELRPVPIFAQSGDDRHLNVDKMIAKRVDVLPHGLINNVETKLGRDGELLAEYIDWVRNRILDRRVDEAYRPVLHFDLYGTLGIAFGHDVDKIAAYVSSLADIAKPFRLRIEHPVDAGSRAGQIREMSALRHTIRAGGAKVELVVDEWCNSIEDIRDFAAAGAADMIHVKTPDLGGINNTIEALLLVRDYGLGAYCGGTCNETDRSSHVCAHVAMACDADQILARPGMGVDEGIMTVANEMARVAALVGAPGQG